MALNSLAIVSQYGIQAMLVIPMLLTMINEATEAVELIGGPGTGEAKKAAVLDAVDAAYDLTSAARPGTIPLDKLAFRALASNLVETVLGLQAVARAVQT